MIAYRAGNTCVVYGRLSSDQDPDATSIATQEAATLAHAAAKGWTVLGSYHDLITSRILHGRPGLTALLERVRAGGVAHVLVYNLDRLVRDQKHLGWLLMEFHPTGTRLATVTAEFEDSPTGTFLTSVVAFAAEMERENIRERMARARTYRVRTLGRLLVGRKPPFGHVFVRDEHGVAQTLAPHPDTAPILADMYARAERGMTLGAIAAWLRETDVPTTFGGVWRRSTVRQVLANPVNHGEVVTWKSRREWVGEVGRTRPATPEEAQAMPTGTAIPIVSENLYNRVIESGVSKPGHSTRRRPTTDRHGLEHFLLRGRVRCGACGRTMQTVIHEVNGNGVIHRYYKCRDVLQTNHPGPLGSVKATEADTAAWSRLVDVLTDTQLNARLAQSGRTDVTAEVVTLTQQLQGWEKRQRAIIASAALLDPDDDAFAAAQEEVSRQLNLATSGRRDVRRALDALTDNSVDEVRARNLAAIASIQALASEVHMYATPEERRHLIDLADVTVTVTMGAAGTRRVHTRTLRASIGVVDFFAA